MDYTTLAPPRHLYRYVRSSGEVTYYACNRQELHQVYPKDAQPISEKGSTLEVVPDDGSRAFKQLYQEAEQASVHRVERRKRKR